LVAGEAVKKVCHKCGDTKNQEDFYKRAKSSDGFSPWCKDCENTNRTKNRAATKRRRNKVIPETKKCRKCGKVKPAGSFSSMKTSTDGRYTYCKPCKAEMVRSYTERNSELVREKSRKRNATPKGRLATRKANLQQSFGMTKAMFDRKWRDQGRVCAICGKKRKRGEKAFVVDHDHKTDVIRGILCHYCNRALGLADDNIELLKLAAAYLLKYQRRRQKSKLVKA